MKKEISKESRQELTEAIRQRYATASKQDKSRILDEFVAMTGYHRKHAIRVLGSSDQSTSMERPCGNRIYDEAVKEALIILWEASDRICSKRLKAILPDMIDAMERNGHLALDPEVRKRLLSISASSIDRLMMPVRRKARSRKKKNAPRKASKQIPVKTFSDWSEPLPGELEIDFVLHCGNSASGVYVSSLVATDVCSGWTEAVPLLARETTLVMGGLDLLCDQFPVPVIGLNVDNDSTFINDALVAYCESKNLMFTRSRPYRKNDQAWIEQKNGAVIRRFVGYDRFSGEVAGKILTQLYQSLRLYVNYFQPSFKLREKTREGARVKKVYHAPATPADRLVQDERISDEDKARLTSEMSRVDPLRLLHIIRDCQSALAAITSPESADSPGCDSLNEFLAHLPLLWKEGEARPTHRKYRVSTTERYWRTRKDPFEDVWPEILYWLSETPDATAKSLFEQLMVKYPGKFQSGQLRTLQRRVKEWRHVMAHELVFACNEPEDDLVPACR